MSAGDGSPRAVAQALLGVLVPQGPGSARARTAVVYERLTEALRDDALRELVDRDYADVDAQFDRLLGAAARRVDPAFVRSLVEGRLLRWLATDASMRALVETVADDLRGIGVDG